MKIAPQEQMFDFITEEIPHRECEHEPLGSPVVMRDVMDQLDIIALLGAMKRNRPVGLNELPAIRQREFRTTLGLFEKRGIEHAPRIGLKEINDQSPARREMRARMPETRQLPRYLEQMLKRPERNDGQREFAAEIEFRHVAMVQVNWRLHLDRLAGKFLAATLQHRFGNVEARDADSFSSRARSTRPVPQPSSNTRPRASRAAAR